MDWQATGERSAPWVVHVCPGDGYFRDTAQGCPSERLPDGSLLRSYYAGVGPGGDDTELGGFAGVSACSDHCKSYRSFLPVGRFL